MALETQVSVFVQNRVGALHDICTALAEARVNIRSLATVPDVDWAIVGVIVDDTPRAVATLTRMGLNCGESQVLTVLLENRPGALLEVTRRLADANISILQAHQTAHGDQALLVMMTTDNKRADEVLS